MKRILMPPAALLIGLLIIAAPARAANYIILQNVTTTQTQTSNNAVQPTSNDNPSGPVAFQAFQIVVVGTGSVSATVQIIGSVDGVNWVNYGSAITATGTSLAINGATGSTPYKFLSAYVTAISGTGASCTVQMSA